MASPHRGIFSVFRISRFRLTSEPVGIVSEPAGRALNPVGRASKQARRASEEAGRASEPAGRALVLHCPHSVHFTTLHSKT